MNFDEAWTRAEAAHVRVDTFNQPGNDYRTEHRCKCGAFVFATNWNQHVLSAADELLSAAAPPVPPSPKGQA